MTKVLVIALEIGISWVGIILPDIIVHGKLFMSRVVAGDPVDGIGPVVELQLLRRAHHHHRHPRPGQRVHSAQSRQQVRIHGGA